MVGEDGQGIGPPPRCWGWGGCACQRPSLSGCSNPPAGGSGDKMLDWGSGVRGRAVFGGRRWLGRGGRRGAGVGRGTSGLWWHASVVVAVRRLPAWAGAGPGPGRGRRRPARSGCDGPGGRACGPLSGRPGCHLSGSSPGCRGRGRGRSGGRMRWAASNNAQRRTCGPWRDRWPGLRLRSELCTVTSRPVWRTTASPLPKRRASPNSARMVGAISIPIP
jgi:hypothetical protein